MVGLRFILIVWSAVWTLLTAAFSWKRLPWQHNQAQKPTGYIKLATQHPKFELTDVADKIISIIYSFLYSFKFLTKPLLIRGKYCSKFKVCAYSKQYLSSCWQAGLNESRPVQRVDEADLSKLTLHSNGVNR